MFGTRRVRDQGVVHFGTSPFRYHANHDVTFGTTTSTISVHPVRYHVDHFGTKIFLLGIFADADDNFDARIPMAYIHCTQVQVGLPPSAQITSLMLHQATLQRLAAAALLNNDLYCVSRQEARCEWTTCRKGCRPFALLKDNKQYWHVLLRPMASCQKRCGSAQSGDSHQN